MLITHGHRQATTALLGLVLFAVCWAILNVAHGTGLAVLAGLAVLGVVPGCAVSCWFPVQDRLTRILSVITGGLTWSTLVCTALAITQDVTSPTVLWGTGGAGAAGCAVFLLLREFRRGLEPRQERPGRVGWARTAFRTVPDGPIDPSRITATGLLTIAFMLLVLSFVQTRGKVVGDFGLLPVLGLAFVASVVLAVGIQVWALVRQVHGVAACATALVVLALNATPAVLIDTALASWSYKHFGVVDLIVRQWPLADPLDAYQRWPGFFAGAAGLVAMSGVDPTSYANWAQPFYELLNALVIFAIGRRLAPRHPGVPYIAVLIFVCTAWEGQRYYAPQTHAFLLTLLMQFFALPLMEPLRLRFAVLWDYRRKANRAYYAPPVWQAEERRVSGGQAVLLQLGLLLVFVAVDVSHQLTPFMIVVGMGALWVLGVFRRFWFGVAMVVVIAITLWLNSASLGRMPTFTGFSFLNARGNVPAGTVAPAQELATSLAVPIGIGTWLVAFLCILSYRRRMRDVVVVACLALAPFALVLAGNYGGEAIYRVFLFTSPWCALIMAMRVSDLRAWPLLRWTLVGTLASGAALGSCQAQGFGLIPLIFVPPGEVAASAYFLDHAPRGSSLVLAGANFPSRLNANYTLHNPTKTPNDPAFSEDPNLRGDKLLKLTDKQLAQKVSELAEGRGYLVISSTMYRYALYGGVYTPQQLDQLTKTVTRSRYFTLWYDKDGVLILEAKP